MMDKGKNKKFFSRYTALIFIAIAIFSVLIIKLIYVQIVNNQYYEQQSNNDSIKEISEPGPRGDIVDRNDVVLATDVQSYVVTFIETDKSKEEFFDIMEKVFSILDSKNEKQKDDFYLKVPYAFDFDSTDTSVINARKLRFMKDRGIDEYIISKIKSIKNKKYKDLTSKEQKMVDEQMLNMSAEDTFNYLWDNYTKWYLKNKNISQETKDKINNYSLQDKRRFMLVLDALKMQSFSGYKPITISESISRDTAFILQEKLSELPGIDVTQQPKRTYPNGELASSVLGYLSKINSENQEKYTEKGYDVSSDLIGVSGIEGALESRLRGTKGRKIVEVNKSGRVVKERAEMEPYPGQKVQLTISKDLQDIAEKSLLTNLQKARDNPIKEGANTTNANRGAVVVMDVKTGEILALVSEPGFDPNDFAESSKLTPELLKKYYNQDYEELGREYIRQRNLLSVGKNVGKTEDQLLNEMFPIDTSIKSDKPVRKDLYDIFPKPMFNYALSSLIPPGSSFKPLTAVAGLESGVITPSFTYDDEQRYSTGIESHPIDFPNDVANGMCDLKKALAVSSNPYFMEVGRLLRTSFGDDKLAEYAWKYGLGVKPNSNTVPSTGIELQESFGQVYNTWSIKNNYAKTYSIKVMEILKGGIASDFSNATFTPIDLYSYTNDSKDVKKAKTDIINSLKESITTGAFSENRYKELLKKLVEDDDSYNGKTFKASDYNLMIKEIHFYTIDNANYQIYKTPVNMYNASIGQGEDYFTPLQLTDYIATLVNGGNRYKAHLVKKVFDADGNVVEEVKPEILNTTGVSQSTVDAVKEGMNSVTTDGTAAAAFQGFTMETGGKTGSATFKENGKQDEVGRTSYGFFVGFAPYDDPEIAVCAVMFDGGYGASVAPIVRNVYEAYFKDKLKAEGYTPQEDFMKDFYSK